MAMKFNIPEELPKKKVIRIPVAVIYHRSETALSSFCLSMVRWYKRFHHSRYAPLIQISSGGVIAVVSRIAISPSASWALWQIKLYGLLIGLVWMSIGIYNHLMRDPSLQEHTKRRRRE
jgi:hypothetical protein